MEVGKSTCVGGPPMAFGVLVQMFSLYTVENLGLEGNLLVRCWG